MDVRMTYKLRFPDGHEDWFARDAVEEVPRAPWETSRRAGPTSCEMSLLETRPVLDKAYPATSSSLPATTTSLSTVSTASTMQAAPALDTVNTSLGNVAAVFKKLDEDLKTTAQDLEFKRLGMEADYRGKQAALEVQRAELQRERSELEEKMQRELQRRRCELEQEYLSRQTALDVEKAALERAFVTMEDQLQGTAKGLSSRGETLEQEYRLKHSALSEERLALAEQKRQLEEQRSALERDTASFRCALSGERAALLEEMAQELATRSEELERDARRRQAALDLARGVLEDERRIFVEEKRKMTAESVSPSDIIGINMGGERTIQVKRNLLTQCEGTFLCTLFSGRWEQQLPRDKEGNVFFDDPPEVMMPLIEWLRARRDARPGQDVVMPRCDALRHEQALASILDRFGLLPLVKRDAKPERGVDVGARLEASLSSGSQCGSSRASDVNASKPAIAVAPRGSPLLAPRGTLGESTASKTMAAAPSGRAPMPVRPVYNGQQRPAAAPLTAVRQPLPSHRG
eukprot:TRINITY_DN29955_c0_g1_i1.p1 TRINITY_DN29955_c0_g1~~TRINITY_DN29955_c0_g1_i1.p1  ORF type:complete len:571 (-),score=129.96 TRINITY_DN29955_c0_g1_i1:454-2010(-)